MIDIDTSPDILDFKEGEVILFDKPLKISSFEVIRQLKKIVPVKKIGHAGTLDPLAEGLLILCTGKKTKSIVEFQDLPKVYTGKMLLGAESPSYDLETPLMTNIPYLHITQEMIEDAVRQFTGEILHKPPVYSAVKFKGKRSYDLAKKGKNPQLSEKKVHIYEFKITACQLPEIEFIVRCSKGTYIRSLIHDFGKKLGSAAVLIGLRRIRIGDYRVEKAVNFATFKNIIESATEIIL